MALRIFCCLLVAGLMAASPKPVRAAEESPQATGCIDMMETDPGSDDMEAVEVSAQVDGGCMAANGPVSI